MMGIDFMNIYAILISVNLLHLQYFYTVAQEGGFTKASQLLGTRQPAISSMVKQLEDDLGFKLLERRNQGVHLTQRGREVFEHAKKIFQEVRELQSSLSDIKRDCFGDLIMGASEPIASVLIPEILSSFSTQYPEVYPQFVSGPANYLLKNIQKGTLEFGLFFHLPDLPRNLLVVQKISIPFRLVVRSDLKKQRAVLESFIGSREIDDVTTKKFPTLAKLRQKHPDAKIRFSTNNLSAHKSMVLGGLGVAVLPEFLIQQEIKSGEFSDLLPSENLKFDLKIVFRETAIPSTNAKEFLKSLRGYFKTS